MAWRHRRHVFSPPDSLAWARTHAAVPIVLNTVSSRCEVLFSGRDGEGRSHTGRATVFIDGGGPSLVSETPLLSPGPPGAFDDSGAMGTWLTEFENRLYLYYIGWNRGVTVPFRNALGLAISEDGGRTFAKLEGPVLDRSRTDPYFVASASVIVDDAMWRMWYVSCTGWTSCLRGPRHDYVIKYAESQNGIDWKPTGLISIGFKGVGEYAISRPCVLKDGASYRMWYSYRGERYRIGYAESADGLQWTRDDDRGLSPAESGWDSEMVEYPYVWDYGSRRLMLYNGNDYGRTGIGAAEFVGPR